jgi:hypothetical protein
MINLNITNLKMLICLIILTLTTESFSQSHFVQDNIPSDEANEVYNALASGCEQEEGVFSGKIYDNGNGASKIIWDCYYCKSSSIVEDLIKIQKAICKASCVSGSYVKCSEDGTDYQISDCDYNLPVYYKADDPDTHHCPFKDESSSSNESPSSSSEETDEDDDFSSSGSSGGECTGIGSTCPLSSGSSGFGGGISSSAAYLPGGGCRYTCSVASLNYDCIYYVPGPAVIEYECKTFSCNFASGCDSRVFHFYDNLINIQISQPNRTKPIYLSDCVDMPNFNSPSYIPTERNLGLPEFCGRFTDYVSSGSSSASNASSSSSSSSHSVGSSSSYSEDCYDTYAEAYESSVLTSMACFECGGIANYSVGYAEDIGKYCVRGNCSNYNQSRCLSPPSGGSSGSGSSNSSSSGLTSSSSSGNYGSASSSGNAFVPGADAYYGTEDVFSSGLDNMEPGKCYGLNPDRAPHQGWINTNAQDRWWWIEKPCDGSAPVEQVTPNGCKHNERGENAVYTANDCFSSGLDNMEPDKCYALNPDRGTQYGWINNDAQDSWWWHEVPCGVNPFPKRYISERNSDSFSTEENDSSYIWRSKTKLFYDAAGRRTATHPETRRYLFLPKK